MTKKPLILVYTDNPMCSLACSDAICSILNRTNKYTAMMWGPDSYPKLNGFNLLNKADCIIFPGGEGDADQFDNILYKYKKNIKNYIEKGGKYLGICMGSYFAGKQFFDILGEHTGYAQYIKRPNSTINKTGATTLKIKWKDDNIEIYFHDGAAFFPTDDNFKAKIYALYPNGDIGAMIQSYGKGKVGVIGPHPEAQKWWFYSQSKIKNKWHDCMHEELLIEFVNDLMNK